MAETNESVEGREANEPAHEDEELRAEEESARAMEAEVPHPAGYPDPGQEKPD